MWEDCNRSSDGELLAGIDWEAVAVLANVAPASASERRILELAVALAAGHRHPVDLGDALTSLDASNAAAVVEAIAHASGADLRHVHSQLRL